MMMSSEYEKLLVFQCGQVSRSGFYLLLLFLKVPRHAAPPARPPIKSCGVDK